MKFSVTFYYPNNKHISPTLKASILNVWSKFLEQYLPKGAITSQDASTCVNGVKRLPVQNPISQGFVSHTVAVFKLLNQGGKLILEAETSQCIDYPTLSTKLVNLHSKLQEATGFTHLSQEGHLSIPFSF